MNCHEIRRRIARYLDGELSPGTLRELEEHMTRCERCRGEVEELRALRAEWANLPVPAADPSDRASILRAARAVTAAREPANRPWFPHLRGFDWVTASAMAVALLLVWTYRQGEMEKAAERRSRTVLSLAEFRAREEGRTIESGESLTIQWSNRSASE